MQGVYLTVVLDLTSPSSLHRAPSTVSLGLQGDSPRSETLSLRAADTLGWILACGAGCPELCGMFSSILGLCPLDASTLPHL